jgi:hypothetical protein
VIRRTDAAERSEIFLPASDDLFKFVRIVMRELLYNARTTLATWRNDGNESLILFEKAQGYPIELGLAVYKCTIRLLIALESRRKDLVHDWSFASECAGKAERLQYSTMQRIIASTDQ